MEQKEVLQTYELKAWIVSLGSKPIRLVVEEDYSESYEMTEGHVYELENGQYALVTESGCSCYESSQADIDLFPSLKPAMEAYEKWCKENKRSV